MGEIFDAFLMAILLLIGIHVDTIIACALIVKLASMLIGFAFTWKTVFVLSLLSALIKFIFKFKERKQWN